MKPSTEVYQAVLRFYEAVGTGDESALDRIFSRQSGVLVIGTDPHEWWAGYDAIQQALNAHVRESDTRQVTPGDLSAFEEGSVGWAADRRTMRLTGGREITVRETMLFRQEDTDWKLVQFHASVAVPNAEMEG